MEASVVEFITVSKGLVNLSQILIRKWIKNGEMRFAYYFYHTVVVVHDFTKDFFDFWVCVNFYLSLEIEFLQSLFSRAAKSLSLNFACQTKSCCLLVEGSRHRVDNVRILLLNRSPKVSVKFTIFRVFFVS